jgi:hypothetical protein
MREPAVYEQDRRPLAHRLVVEPRAVNFREARLVLGRLRARGHGAHTEQRERDEEDPADAVHVSIHVRLPFFASVVESVKGVGLLRLEVKAAS